MSRGRRQGGGAWERGAGAMVAALRELLTMADGEGRGAAQEGVAADGHPGAHRAAPGAHPGGPRLNARSLARARSRGGAVRGYDASRKLSTHSQPSLPAWVVTIILLPLWAWFANDDDTSSEIVASPCRHDATSTW